MDNTVDNITRFFLSSWQNTKQALVNLSAVETTIPEQVAIYRSIKQYSEWLLKYGESGNTVAQRHKDQTLIGLLDLDLVNRFLKSTEAGVDNNLLQEIWHQIQILSASTSLLPEVETLKPEELPKIFGLQDIQAVSDEYLLRLLHTTRQAMIGLDTLKYLDPIFTFLTIEELTNVSAISREDAILYAMLVQFVWDNFDYLSDSDRHTLIQNYFYKALVVGVPARDILTRFLEQSVTVIFHVIKLGDLIEDLKIKNKERILVNLKTNETQLLPVIIKNFETRNGDRVMNGLAWQEYVGNLYAGFTGRDKYMDWLREVLYLVFNIERDTLANKVLFRNENEAQQYDNEMVDLFTWFLVKERWPKIASYFQSENHRVLLHNFLLQCSLDFNLDDETVVKKFLDFTEFLQSNNIISSTTYLIEFHEDDGKFYWNEEKFLLSNEESRLKKWKEQLFADAKLAVQ